jgi:hypothetical protein
MHGYMPSIRRYRAVSSCAFKFTVIATEMQVYQSKICSRSSANAIVMSSATASRHVIAFASLRRDSRLAPAIDKMFAAKYIIYRLDVVDVVRRTAPALAR